MPGKRSFESLSACTLSCCSKHPHPACRVPKKKFWIARTKEFPAFTCNTWDFYEQFLKLHASCFIVLCNEGTEVRTMRIFGDASDDENGNGNKTYFPLLQLQHPNFVDICEAYQFNNEISVILEYVGFSVEDLLQSSIYPTEREIAYIISQVLIGIRFVWSRELTDPRISTENILISLKGEVKIDHTFFPDNDVHTSADLSSLGTVLLRMMNETKESLDSTEVAWSAELLDFIKVTACTSPDVLCDVSRLRNMLKGGGGPGASLHYDSPPDPSRYGQATKEESWMMHDDLISLWLY